jgi:hypothetical protein
MTLLPSVVPPRVEMTGYDGVVCRVQLVGGEGLLAYAKQEQFCIDQWKSAAQTAKVERNLIDAMAVFSSRRGRTMWSQVQRRR